MRLLCQFIGLLFVTASFAGGCGSGGSSTASLPASENKWITLTAVSAIESSVDLSGTAWVSRSWVGLHCAGIACLYDTSTDNYPGVDITCSNLTTGASGTAVSYYGGGTDWEHRWRATVQTVPGKNTIRISAHDPDGKGGAITVTVYGTTLAVIASTPGYGSTDVSLSPLIQVMFNKPVDSDTVNDSTFFVSGPTGTVSGTISVNNSTITFSPLLLRYGARYTVTITKGIRDLAGYPMVEVFSWPFMTAAGPATNAASNVADVSATLNGQFENAAGDTTAAWFEYGTTTAYGSSTAVQQYAASGTLPFSAGVSGLSNWTTYHYRLVVLNGAGTYYGQDQAFKTYLTGVALASGLDAPADLHLESGNIFWVEVYGHAVKSVPVSGGTTTIIAASDMGGNQATLALNSTTVYWSDWGTIWMKERSNGTETVVVSRPYVSNLCLSATDLYFTSDGGIEKIDLVSNAVSTVVAPNSQNSGMSYSGLAVDALNIYWGDGASIKKIARTGGPIVTLAQGLDGAVYGLLLDGGYLYWAERTAIKRMSVSSAVIETIVGNLGSAWSIAKDATRLYWADYYGATINQIDLATHQVVTLAVGQSFGSSSGPQSIAVDDESVYWIVSGSSYYPPLGEIRKAPKIQQ